MAFNPFHGFRKHQKTLLAGITVFCMVIFVLQTGLTKGDFFGLFDRPNQGRGKSEKAATLYGKTVTAEEIAELTQQRRLADQYIRNALILGQQEVLRRVDGELVSLLKSDENALKVVNQAKSLHQFLPMLARQQGADLGRMMGLVDQNLMQLQSLQAGFLSAKRETEAALTRDLLELLRQDQHMLTQQQGQLFFGGNGRDLKELLDFKIWLHQADRLGVQLGNADIGKMINEEALGQLGAQGFKVLDQYIFSTYRNITPEILSQALGNEFRVRIAKAALLGYNARPDPEQSYAVLPPVTPFEYYQYFRNARTESEVALLPIPVKSKDFLAAAGQPNEDELKKLYEEGKIFEPSPALPKPGFKEPERVTVEWVQARAESPWYHEQAKLALQAMQGTLQATAGTALPVGGLAGAVDAVLPLAFDLPLIGKYESDAKYRFSSASWLDPWRYNLHDQNMHRAENAASLIGQAVAGVLGGPLAYVGTGYGFESKERARIGTELILSGATLSALKTAGLAYGISPREDYRPLAGVRQYVQERLLDNVARDLVHSNLNNVLDELYRLASGGADRLSKMDSATQPRLLAAVIANAVAAAVDGGTALAAPVAYGSQVVSRDVKDAQRLASRVFLAASSGSPWTAAAAMYQEESIPEQRARAFLAKAIPEYHLEHGTTSMPRNRFNIGDDPGLAPLKQSYALPHAPEGQERSFEQLFFPDFYGAFVPKRWPRVESQQSFANPTQPDSIWNVSAEPFLYWKTGNLAAYTPSFAEAKPKVEEAWRVEKARKLAQAEAERLAAEARKAGPDALKVLKDGSKHASSLIYLDHVARLEKPMFAFATREMDGNSYRPYRLPTAKVEYPSSSFLDQLLDLKEKGQVAVLSNRPETTYYVAALVDRSQPDEAAFYGDFSRHSAALLGLIEQDSHYRERYREAVVARLEKDAGLDIDKSYNDKFNNPRGSSPMQDDTDDQ